EIAKGGSRGARHLLSTPSWPKIAVQEPGQNLSVQCPYNTQHYKEENKAWCRRRVQNKCFVLVNTHHITYQNSAQKGRVRIHDDTQKGIVTITMEKLKVDDAGVYWCALYKPPNLYRIIDVKLAVTKSEYLLVGEMWGLGFLCCRFQPPTFPTLSFLSLTLNLYHLLPDYSRIPATPQRTLSLNSSFTLRTDVEHQLR
uniref:Ig-like domain-containing protein n=1 Tax=Chrysemys picta bellii TaxID=8478 RepID=A0A8C3FDA8_CHRPI